MLESLTKNSSTFVKTLRKWRENTRKLYLKLFRLDVWRWGLQAMCCCAITCPLATIPALREAFSGNGTWAVQTSILVLENTTGATIKKSAERIVGTIGGGLAAYLFVLLAFNKERTVSSSDDLGDSSIVQYSDKFEAGAIMLTYIVLSPFFWAFIRMRFPNNVLIGVYGVLTSHLVAGGAFLGSGALQIAVFRITAVVIGVLVNTCVIHFVFPNRARDQFDHKIVSLLRNMSEILKPIVELEAGFEPDSAKEVIAVNKRTLKEFATAKLRGHSIKKKRKSSVVSDTNQTAAAADHHRTTLFEDNSIVSGTVDDAALASGSLKHTPSKYLMSSGISSKIDQPPLQEESISFTMHSSRKSGKKSKIGSSIRKILTLGFKHTDTDTTRLDQQRASLTSVLHRISSTAAENHESAETSTIFRSPTYFSEVSRFAQQKLGKSTLELEGIKSSSSMVSHEKPNKILPVQLMHDIYMRPKKSAPMSESRKSLETVPVGKRESSSASATSETNDFSKMAPFVSSAGPSFAKSKNEAEASRAQSPVLPPHPPSESHVPANSEFSVLRTVSSASQLSMYFNQQKIDYELLKGRTLQDLATAYVEQVIEAEQRRKLKWSRTLEIIGKCQSTLGTLPQLLVAARQEVSLYSKNVAKQGYSCTKKSIFFPRRQYQRLLSCVQHLFNQIASLFFSMDFQLTQVSRAKVESLYEFFESLHIENALTFSHAAFSAFADQWKCSHYLHPNSASFPSQEPRHSVSSSTTKKPTGKENYSLELAPSFFTASKDLYVLRKLFAGITGAFLFTEVFGSIVSKTVGHIQVALVELAKAFEDKSATARALKAIGDTAEAIWIFNSIRNERSKIYIDIFDTALRAEEQHKQVDSSAVGVNKMNEGTTNSAETRIPEIPWETLIGLDPQIFTNMTDAEHKVFWQSYWRARDRLSVTSGTLMVLRDQLFLLRAIIDQIVNPDYSQEEGAELDFC